MNKLYANDYVNTTRNYLRNFKLYSEYLDNARHMLADIDRQLATESVKTSRYGNEPGGGFSELNGVEVSATRRMDLQQSRDNICSQMFELEGVLGNISRALLKLSEDKRKLIKGYYFDRLPYTDLAGINHYTDRWCRKLIRQAEREIAVMIFGPKAEPDIKLMCTRA